MKTLLLLQALLLSAPIHQALAQESTKSGELSYVIGAQGLRLSSEAQKTIRQIEALRSSQDFEGLCKLAQELMAQDKNVVAAKHENLALLLDLCSAVGSHDYGLENSARKKALTEQIAETALKTDGVPLSFQGGFCNGCSWCRKLRAMKRSGRRCDLKERSHGVRPGTV